MSSISSSLTALDLAYPEAVSPSLSAVLPLADPLPASPGSREDPIIADDFPTPPPATSTDGANALHGILFHTPPGTPLLEAARRLWPTPSDTQSPPRYTPSLGSSSPYQPASPTLAPSFHSSMPSLATIPPDDFSTPGSVSPSPAPRRYRSIKKPRCYRCRQVGHVARLCNNGRDDQRARRSQGRPSSGRVPSSSSRAHRSVGPYPSRNPTSQRTVRLDPTATAYRRHLGHLKSRLEFLTAEINHLEEERHYLVKEVHDLEFGGIPIRPERGEVIHTNWTFPFNPTLWDV